MAARDVQELIDKVPKVELHLHIEGTLEPELAFHLAQRGGVELPYGDVDALREAYRFDDLQSFLDLYYSCCDVLRTEQDFYDLTRAYLERAKLDNVVHAEIFFDPQTHTVRGVSFETAITGITRALESGRQELGISSGLIMCFLRHLSEEEAFATLEQAKPFRDQLLGVGLDSGERGNPPSKFKNVFAAARALGLRAVAHAGEEGPAQYIHEALDLLGVDRIDHGNACESDEALVQRLVRDHVPLTMCPLSNLSLRVISDVSEHNLARLLRRGLQVGVHSDDPAYFGGYIADNYRAVADALDLSVADIVVLAKNAVRAAFIDDAEKARLSAEIDAVASSAAP